MNNKGQIFMAYGIVAFLIILTLFSLIPVFKENLDNSRSESSTLNCPGTPTFNQSNYDNDTSSQKLIRRPVCFVTGISMVYFVGSVLIATIIWAYRRIVK